jgi:DNA helicase-2/ATP-dependent DNA helicase PcrA
MREMAKLKRELAEPIRERVRAWARYRAGLPAFNATHVQNLISVFRWINNPVDQLSGIRVLKMLPGVGKIKASKILAELRPGWYEDWSNAPLVPDAAAYEWKSLADLVAKQKKISRKWPQEYFLVEEWYIPVMADLYSDAVLRAEDIGLLESLATECHSRDEFLNYAGGVAPSECSVA